MRAEPCTADVSIGTCQPIHERALTPIAFKVTARSPAVTCSPAATTTSYSLWSGTDRALLSGWSLAASLVQATSLLVSPAMAETTTTTRLPRSTSPFTSEATWRIRGRSATEVPPNFIAIVAICSRNPVCPALCGGLHRRACCPAQPSKRPDVHFPYRLRRPCRSGQILQAGGGMVGPVGQIRALAQIQSGAALLHPRTGVGPVCSGAPIA